MKRQQQAEAVILITEYVASHPYETQREVAAKFGLSVNQVHWIVRKAGLHKKRGAAVNLFGEGNWVFVPNKSKETGAGK